VNAPLRKYPVTGRIAPTPGAEGTHASTRSESVLASRLLQLQATMLDQDSFDAAAQALATELATLLKFDRAAVGIWRSGSARLIAASHASDLKADAQIVAAFSAAMEEALDQATIVLFPQPSAARPLVTHAHAELRKRYGGLTLTVPLVSRGALFGAFTLAREDDAPLSSAPLALCEELAWLAGATLQLKFESDRSWYVRLWHSTRKHVDELRAPRRFAAKALLVAGAAAAVTLLMLPVPYRIGGEARIEGSIQRALVAPADGFLRQVYVRPGDRVKANAVLAELGSEDLRLDQRRWQSELAQYENAASAALARADRAQYVINQARADESRAQLELTDAQLARARIVAPFDAVVIKGDLNPSLGAPVRRGDVLMTVAPHGEFRLVAEVDERDIAGIEVGQKGTVALGALADRALGFEVSRVTPVAVARDGRNFFEVEGRLDAIPPVLRPGLRGAVKIESGRRPLAWIWTHRVVDMLRLALWSWGL
jgi:HlyD family secretion protein/GAF domain-containing protein